MSNFEARFETLMSFKPSDWFHIGWIAEGMNTPEGFQLYIDGTKIDPPVKTTFQSSAKEDAAYIGASATGKKHASVQIDELLIFTAQLNQADLVMLMNSAV